jgi:SAM-dependent methyltransferase
MTPPSNNLSAPSAAGATCRFCRAPLRHTFADLGSSPLCQQHLTPEQFNKMEPFYPLHAWVCEQCFLVQLEEYVMPGDIFSDYAYFSSYSDSWLAHAKAYTRLMGERFGIGLKSKVVEIASNDGYLLQYFVEMGVNVLGVEPAANVAQVAVERGIPSVVKFFGRKTAAEIAAEQGKADLLLGNNVLAHVPDINDFVAGMKILLADQGIITMEFPHLMRLMERNQFDTIYHEHFSYLSFSTVRAIFAAHGLTLFDVEELQTHGGSIRIYARHAADQSHVIDGRVERMLQREQSAGFGRVETYEKFDQQVKATKRKLLKFLIEAKEAGKSIAGYGAPGKGNTLLNYCGIRTDFLDYTVDRSPHKQGNFLPGSRIPIHAPEIIQQTRPDYLLILPWNLKEEIMQQTAYIRQWNGKWIVPIPEVEVCS